MTRKNKTLKNIKQMWETLATLFETRKETYEKEAKERKMK